MTGTSTVPAPETIVNVFWQGKVRVGATLLRDTSFCGIPHALVRFVDGGGKQLTRTMKWKDGPPAKGQRGTAFAFPDEKVNP